MSLFEAGSHLQASLLWISLQSTAASTSPVRDDRQAPGCLEFNWCFHTLQLYHCWHRSETSPGIRKLSHSQREYMSSKTFFSWKLKFYHWQQIHSLKGTRLVACVTSPNYLTSLYQSLMHSSARREPSLLHAEVLYDHDWFPRRTKDMSRLQSFYCFIKWVLNRNNCFSFLFSGNVCHM